MGFLCIKQTADKLVKALGDVQDVCDIQVAVC